MADGFAINTAPQIFSPCSIAERTLLQAQDQLAQSETNTATAVNALYKALGGGWQ